MVRGTINPKVPNGELAWPGRQEAAMVRLHDQRRLPGVVVGGGARRARLQDREVARVALDQEDRSALQAHAATANEDGEEEKVGEILENSTKCQENCYLR